MQIQKSTKTQSANTVVTSAAGQAGGPIATPAPSSNEPGKFHDQATLSVRSNPYPQSGGFRESTVGQHEGWSLLQELEDSGYTQEEIMSGGVMKDVGRVNSLRNPNLLIPGKTLVLPVKEHTEDSSELQSTGVAHVASRTARGEFSKMALRTGSSFSTYANLTSDEILPDDIRLTQMRKAASKENQKVVSELQSGLDKSGVKAKVYGRAKTEFSMWNKLNKWSDERVKDVRDASGIRVDFENPGEDYKLARDVQSQAHTQLGQSGTSKDYVKAPNEWGYRGRLHSFLESESVPAHETQFGTKDISRLIDTKVTNSSGESRQLHDLTGYKGKVYGVKVPDSLQKEYTDLMGAITENHVAGRNLDGNPVLKKRMDKFHQDVQAILPEKFSEAPTPELRAPAKKRMTAGKVLGGLGVLGAFQIAAGGEQLLNGGDKLEASKDLAAGTIDVGSGLTALKGAVKASGLLSGAAATVDGAHDLYLGVANGDLEKGSLGALKASSGSLMIAGTMTANPVLLAIGAVGYGGSVLYENWDSLKSGAAYLADKIVD